MILLPQKETYYRFILSNVTDEDVAEAQDVIALGLTNKPIDLKQGKIVQVFQITLFVTFKKN